jgi:hypothetical protein
MHHDNKTYYEIMMMPTDVRINYIDFLINVGKEKQKQYDDIKSKSLSSEQTNTTNPNIT